MLAADTKAHRFKVGDKVKMRRITIGNTVEAFLDRFKLPEAIERPGEVWEVVRLRPADDLGHQYHVRPLSGGQERLVHEQQLEPAG